MNTLMAELQKLVLAIQDKVLLFREPVTQEQHFCVEKQQCAGSACTAKNARGGLQVRC